MSDAVAKYTPSEIQQMAAAVVRSGLFSGIKNEAQAMTLFMLADANGMHPMKAALMYDILPNGKPSMKGEAMLAEFYARGGTVKWLRRDSEECRGLFKSPGCPEGFEANFTIEDARTAQLAGKDNWKKYAADMLMWRCVTRGVKATLPTAGLGLYPSEVAQDFEPQTVKADAEVEEYKGTQRLVCDINEPVRIDSLDLTAQLTESIEVVQARKYAAEAKARSAAAVDAYVTVRCPDCASECLVYESSQTGKNFKRKYRQCKVAHENIEYLISQEGFTAQKASALNAKHYRVWTEPPRKTAPDEGAAAETGSISEPPPSEQPAPVSIFDPEQIAADVAARLAKEKK